MQDLTNRSDSLDLTIIIVSYNTREMTLACIRSIMEQTSSIRFEVIVVDNASTDGSGEAIRTEFSSVQLIASQENLGFGRANNVAAGQAQGRRLLLLNPDTVILDHGIDRLYEFAVANPQCRIWGGRTVFADGSLNPQSCWRRMTLWSLLCNATGMNTLKESSLFNSEGYGSWKRDTVRAVDIVVGCFLLIDKDLWEHLHGFDPVFFMYGEEADLCLRARQIGAHPTVTPNATIIHHGGASEPDRLDQLIKLMTGKVTLIKRHWSNPFAHLGRFLLLMMPLTRMTAYGSAGTLTGNADFRRSAQLWRDVWRSRARWITGWNEALGTKAPRDLDAEALASRWATEKVSVQVPQHGPPREG
jgi:N-acetylglucosaminyl-diphospho-decaprenol L-rhamnosyltransferase